MQMHLDIDVNLLTAENAYWTAREICQQPDAWSIAHTAIARQRDRIERWLQPKLADSRLRILLTGAGSSSFVGETLAPWLTRKLHRRVDAVATTDLVGSPDLYLAEDIPTLMVSFARSGNSPESVASVTLANQLLGCCHHLVLTCNREGQLAHQARRNRDMLCLWMPEGTNDSSFAMTSSYTAMLVACAAIFATDSDSLNQAIESARVVLDNLVCRAQALAAGHFNRLVVLGAGCLHATAREACLKCVELTNGKLTVTADTPLGFRHGPKSVVDENTVIILLRSADPYTAQYDLDLLLELCVERRAAKVVVLSRDDIGDNHQGGGDYWHALRSASPLTVERLLALGSDDQAEVICMTSGADSGPNGLDDFWISLPYVVFCQVFAFLKARALGVSADNPCPSGEVNRVVKGVTIHAFRR